MRPEAVWDTIHTERAALADLLETLSPGEWECPSLCRGWTVRHVAAHVISSPQARLGPTALALARARGNFDRCIHDAAVVSAQRPVEQIVADYRRFAGSRRHPPGTTQLEPLLDVLVHTQDIVIPLGRPRPMPTAAARVAADRVWRKGFPFHARTRLRGFRLTATDVSWSVGQGLAIEGPIESLLLLLTGRTASLPQLSGRGLASLVRQLDEVTP